MLGLKHKTHIRWIRSRHTFIYASFQSVALRNVSCFSALCQNFKLSLNFFSKYSSFELCFVILCLICLYNICIYLYGSVTVISWMILVRHLHEHYKYICFHNNRYYGWIFRLDTDSLYQTHIIREYALSFSRTESKFLIFSYSYGIWSVCEQPLHAAWAYWCWSTSAARAKCTRIETYFAAIYFLVKK